MTRSFASVSLQDIAARTNVTPRTVARVLSGDYVARQPKAVERANRIRQVADELGFRPNATARAMKRGRFNTVGYVSFMFEDGTEGNGEYFAKVSGVVMAAICRTLADHGRQLNYSLVRQTDLAEGRMPAVIREAMVDALVLDGSGLLPDLVLAEVERYRIPHVAINLRREFDCVHPDDVGSTRLGTRALLEAGHRRIAMINNSHGKKFRDHYSVEDRAAGYLELMQEAGLKPIVLRTPTINPRHGDSDPTPILEMLRAPDRPTALITYEEGQAHQAYLAAVRLGLEVPRDLSIITVHRSSEFADLPRLDGKTFDTMHAPEDQIGLAAADMVLQKSRQPDVPLPAVSIAFKHTRGATLAPPSS
ncbi:MAG: LacI family DNA-binding transcriptional regulator [Planctomycetota bacterium]